MPIDVTTSTQSMAAAQAAQTSSVNQTASKTTDTSFQDEMTKVTESEQKETKADSKKENADNTLKKEPAKTEQKQKTSLKDTQKTEVNSKENKIQTNKKENEMMQASLNFNQMALNNANNMLSNDIAQVVETNLNTEYAQKTPVWSLSFGESSKTNIKMNETDAQFFINLTQNDNVNIDGIAAHAQNLINNGTDFKQVAQNFKVSQALLTALKESRQNNQPIRIDFDQNISVILRVGKDGAISANFIPGDKAVEQYLRNNIDSLKNAFEEQELNYAELTYSNSSKEQNQRRREENKEK